jgi:hypothetical protein
MSNRIDFFQSEQTSLTLPASSVSILIDGALCPNLELIEITRRGWPDFSQARFTYNPSAYATQGFIFTEDIESEFAMGQTVSIRQYYNGIPPGMATFSIPIFHGHIECIRTKLSKTGERVEIIANDISKALKRIFVHGQRLIKTNDSSIFLAGLDTIFNPDTQGNASFEAIAINGKSYTVFCAESSQSKLWSYAEVIDYLLCEYIPPGQCQRPTFTQLKALTSMSRN